MYTKEEQIIINKFSIPKIQGIKEGELILVTNSKGIDENFSCDNGCFKFGLEKKTEKGNLIIFKMEFFKRRLNHQKLFNLPPSIRLELLWVNANYRQMSIATYYMNKLVQYAKEEDINEIRIAFNPDAPYFQQDDKHNRLSKKDLKDFYKSFEEDDVKIKFIIEEQENNNC